MFWRLLTLISQVVSGVILLAMLFGAIAFFKLLWNDENE